MGRACSALLVGLSVGGLAGCSALTGLDSLALDECADGCDAATLPGAPTSGDSGSPTGSDGAPDPIGPTADGGGAGFGSGSDGAFGGGPGPANDSGPTGPTNDAGTDAGGPAADAGGGGGDASCPGTAGPVAVHVDGFCIDSTEVTNTQYAAFLTATNNGATTTGQPSYCSWNNSYVPSNNWPNSNGDDPVGFVDWCDAYMFCQWAGKRLCGAIGGGPNPFGSFADAQSSQWYNACSKAGTLAYPYGTQFDNSKCNGNVPQGKVAVVASHAGCVGGYSGLYDMSGNVWEWEDSCQTTNGSSDTCRVHGGAADAPASEMSCAVDSTSVAPLSRNGRYFDIGFRCCGP